MELIFERLYVNIKMMLQPQDCIWGRVFPVAVLQDRFKRTSKQQVNKSNIDLQAYELFYSLL